MTPHDQKVFAFVKNLIGLRGGNLQAYKNVTAEFKSIADVKASQSLQERDDVACRWLQGEAKAWLEVYRMFEDATTTFEKLKAGGADNG